jgi:hypothetical protein
MVTGDIEHKHGCNCVLEVEGDERAVALLAGCIPELHAVYLAFVANVGAHEVDPDGRLRDCYWYILIGFEFVVDEPFDEGGLTDGGIAQKHYFYVLFV